jgi:hypothetical protein
MLGLEALVCLTLCWQDSEANMGIAEIIAIFNIVAPEVFSFINQQKQTTNPATGQLWTYAEILADAGVKLDAEHAQLMQDLAADIAAGAH